MLRMDIKNVCVIGAGAMGSGIAQICAANGYNVNLVDVNDEILQKAKDKIKGTLERFFVAKGKMTAEDAETILNRINLNANRDEAVKDVDIDTARSYPPTRMFCLSASSLMTTEDQAADVKDWYYQQGWEFTQTPPGKQLRWQPLPRLQLGPVETRFLSLVFISRRAAHGLTEIHIGGQLCVDW